MVEKVECLLDPTRSMPQACRSPIEHGVLVDKTTLDMMCAVALKKTSVIYNQFHFCNEHQCRVDYKHINNCKLLAPDYNITRFNERLK